jgi:alkylation response protein AidB-like acyl-CoA dehydrogenase
VTVTEADDDARFAAEVRAFVGAELPAHVRAKVRAGEELERAEYVDWQRRLFERGWAAPAWPLAFGGCAWSARRRWIFEREMAAGWAPRNVNSGMFMLGPVLIAFGTAGQQARYLPRILAADDWWCQGFSEPNAGSDLASLRTSAVRDGGDYIVNGEKVWVTFAQHATRMFFLARTDPGVKPQAGISFFLVDMATPGLTVKPIATADGYAEINAVSFVNVRVPAENRVGAEGQGWTCAKFLLANERDVAADLGGSFQIVERIHDAARRRPLDPAFAAQLAELEIRLTMLAHAQLHASEAAERDPERAAPSFLKLAGSELQQALLRLLVEACAGDLPRDVAANDLNGRKLSIYAGTNEVHRDLLARYLLGA